MATVIEHKVFKYKDKMHMRIIPSKRLFNSTMVHEVVNRGDVFALNLETGIFTIIPGTFIPVFITTFKVGYGQP